MIRSFIIRLELWPHAETSMLDGGNKPDVSRLQRDLPDLVEHVSLYFRHEKRHGTTFCTFVRGVIHVSTGVLPPGFSPSTFQSEASST
jgi:hypothetical protein